MESSLKKPVVPEAILPGDQSTAANVVIDNHHPKGSDKLSEILRGLQQDQKYIDPKYFYDARGSGLFEQITRLPEYYPTRTERQILSKNAVAMSRICGQGCVLIEPGSGSSEKVRLLLDTLHPAAYVPMDISAEFLEKSALKLGAEYPWLNVHAICTDFVHQEKMPEGLPDGKRVIFYPGSTLGNMSPVQACGFLRQLGQWLNGDGGILVGIDMHKSKQILDDAYNDQLGITAEFNLNVLNNVNSLTGSNFKIENFGHRAFYNESDYRIEMHLVSKLDHIVRVGLTEIKFTCGETIHTEDSYKYTPESFQNISQDAGFSIRSSWSDDQQLFSVHYLELTQ